VGSSLLPIPFQVVARLIKEGMDSAFKFQCPEWRRSTPYLQYIAQHDPRRRAYAIPHLQMETHGEDKRRGQGLQDALDAPSKAQRAAVRGVDPSLRKKGQGDPLIPQCHDFGQGSTEGQGPLRIKAAPADPTQDGVRF
jgi:hypothetical protein